jgi:hypothetical protein
MATREGVDLVFGGRSCLDFARDVRVVNYDQAR